MLQCVVNVLSMAFWPFDWSAGWYHMHIIDMLFYMLFAWLIEMDYHIFAVTLNSRMFSIVVVQITLNMYEYVLHVFDLLLKSR